MEEVGKKFKVQNVVPKWRLSTSTVRGVEIGVREISDLPMNNMAILVLRTLLSMDIL
jgi:hypothetical protein